MRKVDHNYLMSLYTDAQRESDDIHRQFNLLHEFAFSLDNAESFNFDAQVIGKYNIIRSQINQIVNPVMETPPEPTVFPGDGASKADAMLLGGHLRHLEEKCCAGDTFSRSLREEVSGGLGAWMLVLEEDEDGDLEPLLDYLLPTQVFFDPASRRADRRDARFVIVEREMNEDDFYEEWPEATRQTGSDVVGEVSSAIKFYECYIKVRRGGEKAINRYVFTKTEIVNAKEAATYPGAYLPVFLYSCPMISHNNRKLLLPLTLDLKDLQNEINYWRTQMASLIGRAPKSQWRAAAGTIAPGDEESYANSSGEDADCILYYDAKDGKPAPEPIAAPEIPASYIQLSQANLQFARDITGIFPDQGNQTQQGMNQASGEALKQQRSIANIASYHFIQPWLYAIKLTGEAWIDLIVRVENGSSKVRVSMQSDKSTQLVSFGPTVVNKPGVKNLDLEEGKYGVVVKIGASYATQKQELLSTIGDWSAKNEKIAELSAGFIMSQYPIPGAAEFGELLNIALLPPAAQQYLANKQSADPEQQVQSLMMQIQQLRQQGMLQQKQLQLAETELQKADAEMQQLKLKLDTGSDIKLKLAQIDLEIAKLNAASRKDVAELDNNTRRMVASQQSSTELEKSAIAANTSLDREDLIHRQHTSERVLDQVFNHLEQPTNQ